MRMNVREHRVSATPGKRHLLLSGVGVLLACGAVAQSNERMCGALPSGGYGPYDYRTDRDKLPIVDGAHFTPQVEALIRGQSSLLGDDIDYTLAKFPNHHRALLALVRWGEKTKSPQPPALKWSIECYFDRAMRWRADDSLVRLIYAKFLLNNRRINDADVQLETAAAAAKDNAFTQYNIGLVYLEVKNYPKALQYAHAAEKLGFTGTALRDELKKAGAWRDAEPEPEAAPDGPAADK